MARNGRTATAAVGSAPAGETRSQDTLGVQGVDTARAWLGSSLASLTGLAGWLERWQALNGSALSGWSRTLAQCSRDLDLARDPEQFMALPAQMVNHHLEQTSHQLGQAMQGLFEAQTQWAEQWRREVADQARQTAGPAAIGQLQDQWLAMTRQWVDALGAAVPASQQPAAH